MIAGILSSLEMVSHLSMGIFQEKKRMLTRVLIPFSANQNIHPDENQPQGSGQLRSQAGYVHSGQEGEVRSKAWGHDHRISQGSSASRQGEERGRRLRSGRPRCHEERAQRWQ